MSGHGAADDGHGKLVATVLGYSVVLGSLTVKLPIIKNVMACKDPECLSLSSLYLECLALLCSSTYSMRMQAPLSTYAELLSVFVQNIVIIALMWKYGAKTFGFMGLAVAGVALFEATLLGMDDSLMWMMPLASTSISVSGQLPQILSNYRSGHTGALSIITQTLNVLGTSVRVFTTIQLVDDPLTLASCLISTAIQLTLFVQILSMRANTAKVMAARASEKSASAKKAD